MNLNLHPPKQSVSELKTLLRRTTAENKVLRILYSLDFLFFLNQDLEGFSRHLILIGILILEVFYLLLESTKALSEMCVKKTFRKKRTV